jgi:hypothetical protein
MIQRVQTIYLLIASAILVCMFFFAYGALQLPDGQILVLHLTGLKSLVEGEALLFPTWHLAIIIGISAAVLMISIFQFRNRLLQIRLSIFNILLLLGYYAMLFFMISRMKAEFSGMVLYRLPVMFPLVSVILIFMAIRAIRKDIILLRSYDRIR